MLSPLLGIIALVVKLSDGGAILYRGLRTGLDGRQFRAWKLRTMVIDAEKTGVTATADDNLRITRVGRFLRKYKLDELRQLMKVLIGEMSLVGPRPEVPQCTALFTAEEQAILSVRPGITDWAILRDTAQGAVLAGSVDPEQAYLDKAGEDKAATEVCPGAFVRHGHEDSHADPPGLGRPSPPAGAWARQLNRPGENPPQIAHMARAEVRRQRLEGRTQKCGGGSLQTAIDFDALQRDPARLMRRPVLALASRQVLTWLLPCRFGAQPYVRVRSRAA